VPAVDVQPSPILKSRYVFGNSMARVLRIYFHESDASEFPGTTPTMIAQSVFSGKVDKKKAQSDYTLKVKACNPGC
jgi:hypothetical protein